jgi:uncharacterized membrane protein YgcG
MKTSLWKTLAALTLVAALLAGASALALARYPAQGGALTDDANVIGQAVAADVAAYAEKAKAETGVSVHVALVQFLDGEPVQTYADTLFTRWALGESDVLLLGAAAEDTFAVTAGKAAAQKLSAASLKSLLYDSGFAEAFTAQRYDEALGGFFTGLNALLEKQYQTAVGLDGLFTGYAAQAAAQAQTGTAAQSAGMVGQTVGSALDGALSAVDGAVQSAVEATSGAWNSTVNAVTDTVNRFQQGWDRQDENGGGLTPGGWVVLVIIVLIVSRQGRRASRSSKRYAEAARQARGAREAAQQARAEAYRTRDAARDAAHEVRDAARDAARQARDAARKAADEACKWCGRQ